MRILGLVLTALAAAPWSWPVDGPQEVIRPYIAPASAYAAGHRGVDLAAGSGALHAPADGVVHFAGNVAGRPVLSVDHGDGVLSSYEPVQSALVRGEPVARGQFLGSVLPGHCSRLCVHVGVRVQGDYVSPLKFLDQIPRAVLLPTRRIWADAGLDTAGSLHSGARMVVRLAGAPVGRSP